MREMVTMSLEHPLLFGFCPQSSCFFKDVSGFMITKEKEVDCPEADFKVDHEHSRRLKSERDKCSNRHS
jgi:hypothetical protein